MSEKGSLSPKPPSRGRRLFKWAVGIAAVGALAVVGGGYFWVRKSEVMTEYMTQTVQRIPPKEIFEGKDMTILLIGCDEDLAPGGYKNPEGKQIVNRRMRSDMMLVARVNFERKTLTGVSIPRDTECRLPGYRTHKINAYHAMAKKDEAGDLTKQAVEHVLPGVKIDRVLTIDYEAFQKLVNLAGGVRVDIDRRMKYTDRAGGLFIDFKPGANQLLNGYDAMCYVRYRKGDSDFVRQDRQKQFLVALKNSLVADPSKAGAVADQAVAVLGGGLNIREMVALARFSQELPANSIRMGMIPVVPGRGTNLKVDQRKLPETLRSFGL
ncbi:LytR family transcriptional regulator [bacterium]|nr:MAG: LytR family transcriptional regulator [bacterium]